MSWLLIAITAYFLYAIATVIDKTLLKKDIPHPVVYVFYIAILGAILMLVIIPFGFAIPNIWTIIIAMLTGAIAVWGLILFYTALKKGEATRVAPMVGGLVPIFVLLFAWYVLQEKLNCNQYIGFVFIILGTFLISLDFQRHGAWHWLKKKLGIMPRKISLPHIRQTLWIALPTAALFGVSNVLTKFIYTQTDFLTGFIWIRLGAFLTVLALLMVPAYRQAIFKNFKKTKHKKKTGKKVGGRFLFGQACGGGGALLREYAIFLGSVTLVNALQGMQYVFVFVFVLALTIFLPKILKEKITKEIFFQKIIAVVLIFIGLYFIAV